MKTLSVFLFSASLSLATVTASAQEGAAPDRLRQESRELMQKARDLKEAGRMEPSEDAARRAKNLAREAEEISRQRERREREGDRGPREEARLRQKQGDRDVPVERRDRVREQPRRQDRQPPRPPMPSERGDRADRGDKPDREQMDRGRGPARPLPGRPLPGFFPGPRRVQPPIPGLRDGRQFGPPPIPGRGFQRPEPFINRPAPPQPPLLRRELGPAARSRGRLPGPGDIEQRRLHIREAIRHLHAAGLHVPAQMLERNAPRAMRRHPVR